MMKTHLNCPCGEVVVGADEDQLVTNVREHLTKIHPGREYSRDEILIMSWWSAYRDKLNRPTAERAARSLSATRLRSTNIGRLAAAGRSAGVQCRNAMNRMTAILISDSFSKR